MIFVKNQLNIIYNNIDFKPRYNVKKSENITTVNLFLANLDDNKHK